MLVCGNGVCEAQLGESVGSCVVDCWCGNGTCDSGEGWGTCPAECGSGYCGDGWCQTGETSVSCTDCYCGNGSCDLDEAPSSCPADCDGPYCGNGICDPGETTSDCLEDCDQGCNHSVCDLLPQCGCAPGENCTMNGTFNRFCTPPGSMQEGDPCFSGADCDMGLVCFAPVVGFARCYRWCLNHPQCTAGPGSICAEAMASAPAGTPELCTDGCDPLINGGCPNGLSCFVLRDTDGVGGTHCLGPMGTSTGACTTPWDCAPGLICDEIDLRCTNYCRTSQGNGDCSSGMTCYSFVPSAVVAGTEYGVCAW